MLLHWFACFAWPVQRKHWRSGVSIALYSCFPSCYLWDMCLRECLKSGLDTKYFLLFFILFTQPFFQLKEEPGFIRYSTMKFLEEMLIYLTGWYFYFFLLTSDCTLHIIMKLNSLLTLFLIFVWNIKLFMKQIYVALRNNFCI